MVDIYAATGSTSDYVTTATNATGTDRPTPIMQVSPERGTFLRFLNKVARGEEIGMPVYFKLKDSNGNPLPNNTELTFEAKQAGHNDEVTVSVKLKNISFWQNNSITTQRNKDNIDNAKVELQYPESAEKSGARPHLDIRDIDDLYVSAVSSAAVDWSQSEFYFDSQAVKQGER